MKTTYDFSQGKRGAVIPTTGKTRITIHLDDEVLEAFRLQAAAQGKAIRLLSMRHYGTPSRPKRPQSLLKAFGRCYAKNSERRNLLMEA
jgi:hypothetical protein